MKDLGVSYHVGFFEGFSVWLVGLTTVVMAAAIAYGVWVGRDHPRAYYGLMLFLTGAIVGVFTAQDLLLFYVFWEAMLIPLYVLIGVWGGPGRLRATIKFVIYTMVGSLLMLGRGDRLRAPGRDVLDDRRRDERQRLDLPRLRGRVHRQGAALPVPRLAAGRLPRVAGGGLGRALGRDLEGGGVRLPAHLLLALPGGRARLPHADPRPGGDRARSTGRCWRSARRTSAA